jgi:hypothetical protein
MRAAVSPSMSARRASGKLKMFGSLSTPSTRLVSSHSLMKVFTVARFFGSISRRSTWASICARVCSWLAAAAWKRASSGIERVMRYEMLLAISYEVSFTCPAFWGSASPSSRRYSRYGDCSMAEMVSSRPASKVAALANSFS